MMEKLEGDGRKVCDDPTNSPRLEIVSAPTFRKIVKGEGLSEHQKMYMEEASRILKDESG